MQARRGNSSKARGVRPATPAARDPDATRARILEAATAEFARFGPGGARVDRIAAAAGANKGMLYYYFGSKEALFQAVLENAYAHIRAAELELSLLDVPPEQGVRRLIEFTWRYFNAHPEFLSLLNSENLDGARHLKSSPNIRAMNSPVIETLRTVLARGARARPHRSAAPARARGSGVAGRHGGKRCSGAGEHGGNGRSSPDGRVRFF